MPTTTCHTCHAVTPHGLNCGNGCDTPSDTPTDLSHTTEGEQAIVPTVVPERHLYRIPEAMRLLSMSRSVIYEQIRAGRLHSVTQGRARLIPAQAINAYVQLLIKESGSGNDQAA